MTPFLSLVFAFFYSVENKHTLLLALVLLRDIHDGLLGKYDCKDNASPPAQPGVRVRPEYDSDGVSQQEAAPLFLPWLDRLYEADSRGEDAL